MSVQSLDEGCPHITDVASPGFVVLVVSVHVVHEASEPPALFVTDLADTELFIVLGNFSLGDLAHLPCLGWLVPLDPRPPPLPGLRRTAGNIIREVWRLNDLTSRFSVHCPAS